MLSKKPRIENINLYNLIIFLYVVSAIAFESTPETAWISTAFIYAVFAVGIVYALLNYKELQINIYIMAMVLLFLCIVIMCLAPKAYASMSVQIMYWFLTCGALCVMAHWMSLGHREIISAVLVATIIGSLIMVIRIVEMYGGVEKVFELASSEGEVRIGKKFNNENAIGLFLSAAVLSCVLFLLKKGRSIWVSLLLIACITIFVVMIFLTGSRKSTIFILVGTVLLVFLCSRKQKGWKQVLILGCVLAILALVLYLLSTIPAFSTIYQRFELLFQGEGYATDETRKYMIEKGLEEFFKHPIFGNGAGYSYDVFGTYSHNNFVELLMCYGIVGFLLYYVPYMILVYRLFKLALQRDEIAIYLFVYIVMELILSVGWVNYYARVPQLMNAIAWGYVLNRPKDNKEEENEVKEHI